MKPYYRIKGKYKDGRKRIVIEWGKEKRKQSKALPKPETLLGLLMDTKDKRKMDEIKEATKEIYDDVFV